MMHKDKFFPVDFDIFVLWSREEGCSARELTNLRNYTHGESIAIYRFERFTQQMAENREQMKTISAAHNKRPAQ